MSKVITLRGIRLGEGIPKICVPLTAVAVGELLDEAALAARAGADLVEWRVDHFGGAGDPAAVGDALERLRATLGDLPLLFTFRTAGEGGQRALSPRDYLELNRMATATGCADLVDVELFSGDDSCRAVVEAAHAAGAAVVISSHDFERTPPREELVARLLRMRSLGGDIPKLAVMPRTSADVLTLLAATDAFVAQTGDCPVIAMSMGPLGSVSRVAGETFGSALTFGAVGRVSAPGQLAVEDLRAVLQILHNAGR